MITSKRDLLIKTAKSALKPKERMDIAEYAAKYRVLSEEASDEPGRWSNERTPYLQEIMWELSPESKARIVVLQKGTQLGGTEVGINMLLYYMDFDPCPIIAIQPTDTLAKRYSKQRISPAIKACNSLREKVKEMPRKSTSDTILMKDFPGGTLMMAGAGSSSQVRSAPVRVLFTDEVDEYQLDLNNQGDTLELAIKRATNFSRSKIFINSTPTVKDFSMIEGWYEESDKRYYNVPCIQCGQMQTISWDRIKWKGNRKNLEYFGLECEGCNRLIQEKEKTEMLLNGEWVKSDESKIAGFQISALYSPYGWYSWEDAITDHLKAVGNPFKRKTFVNTVLGETFEEGMETIDSDSLLKRVEDYKFPVPSLKCYILTCGADVQADRIELFVYGWGVAEEAWLIEHHVIFGRLERKTTENELFTYLRKTFKNPGGIDMTISLTAMDSGGEQTTDVYKFCAKYGFMNIIPIKGEGGTGKPAIIRKTPRKKYNVTLIFFGVDGIKESLYTRLKIEDNAPGYIHFPNHVGKDFFNQLTAEKKIKRIVRGRAVIEWSNKSGKRNEALDGYVYAYGALQLRSPDLIKMSEQGRYYNMDNFSILQQQRTRRRRRRA